MINSNIVNQYIFIFLLYLFLNVKRITRIHKLRYFFFKKKGNTCFEEGQLTKAIHYFVKAIKLDENFYAFFIERGISLIEYEAKYLKIQKKTRKVLSYFKLSFRSIILLMWLNIQEVYFYQYFKQFL
ncbi:hypothetical protein FGO68_gene16273 [Halteria grandinella]|uniref:Tetratricopeptide repeat protein n=1 Tax=Halteria grandinella TaxID=5974 RepID=A0A8J8NG37_HALGN|nr:hypothetical protein FGO68_gene16273 [Halteria grandinella]